MWEPALSDVLGHRFDNGIVRDALEFVRVYASLVRTNQMLQRERESKLTTVAAAVAAIAHEITTADRYKRQQLSGTTCRGGGRY